MALCFKILPWMGGNGWWLSKLWWTNKIISLEIRTQSCQLIYKLVTTVTRTHGGICSCKTLCLWQNFLSTKDQNLWLVNYLRYFISNLFQLFAHIYKNKHALGNVHAVFNTNKLWLLNCWSTSTDCMVWWSANTIVDILWLHWIIMQLVQNQAQILMSVEINEIFLLGNILLRFAIKL